MPTISRKQRTQCRDRRGYTLVLVALCLTALLGIVGVVIDGGLLFVAHRASQNAADAAARACAQALHTGAAENTLQLTAETFAFTHNGIPTGTGSLVTVNHPPSSGPHASNGNYVEVIVTHPIETTFIQVVGVSRAQTVQARAVAGFKSLPISAGLVVLNPRAQPGLSLSGTPEINVNSGVVVYSRYSGQDEYGNAVGQYSGAKAAITMGGSSIFTADALYVSGGVDDYRNYMAPDVDVLHAGTNDPVSDPFHDGTQLPIPQTSNGVINRNLGSPAIKTGSSKGLVSPNSYNSGTGVTTLNPGIYNSISVTGGNVNLMPGIYVLRPTGNATVLKLNGGTVTGSSVMFYNTGSTYVATDGTPDTGDLAYSSETDPPTLAGTNFGDVDIHGNAGITLTGMDAGPFEKILFYQRRLNTKDIAITDANSLDGTFYAKWGNLKLSGSGNYDFAIVVGTINVNGTGSLTINGSTTLIPKIQPVRLVE